MRCFFCVRPPGAKFTAARACARAHGRVAGPCPPSGGMSVCLSLGAAADELSQPSLDFSVKTGVMLGLGAYDDSPSVEGESPAPANAEAAFSPARFEGDGEVAADGGAQRARGAGDLHARRAPPLG